MANKTLLDDQPRIENQRITLPTRSHRWSWIILLLIVVAGVAAWYFMKDKDGIKVVDYATCVQAGGTIMESFPEQCSKNGLTFSNPDQKAPEPVVEEEEVTEPKLASYTDSVNGFEIQYPADFVVADTEVLPPYTNSTITITSKGFSHVIPVKYCNPKGDCIPNTTDMSFALSVVNSSVETISKSAKVSGLKDSTFGTHTFKSFTQGAEGEGIYYYFISLPNKKTLMISRTYLDENILTNYKTAPDFISKADQDKLIEQILTSLTFGTNGGAAILSSDEIKDWATYTNTKWGFTIRHPKDWKVKDSGTAGDPIINIYKTGTPPLIHLSNETHVSVFPQGVGTEGKLGETKNTVDFPVTGQAKSTVSYLLNSKTSYAFMISNFPKVPTNWEEYGFAWGSVKVANYQTECKNQQGNIDPNGCGLGAEPGYTLIEKGTVNETDIKTVRTILSTFAFTK